MMAEEFEPTPTDYTFAGYGTKGPFRYAGGTAVSRDIGGGAVEVWSHPAFAPLGSSATAAPAVVPATYGEAASAALLGDVIPISVGVVRIPGVEIDRKAAADVVEGASFITFADCLGFWLDPNDPPELGRIWANGKPIYDPAEAIDPYGLAAKMAFYPGDYVQGVDAVLEEIHGAGNTPAYLGRVYVRIRDFPVADFNNLKPSLSYELKSRGVFAVYKPWGGTWNSADRHDDLALSNGNLTVERVGNTTASWSALVRGTIGRDSGQYYLEVELDSLYPGEGVSTEPDIGFGLALASQPLDDNYVGYSDLGVGCITDGRVYLPGPLSGCPVWDQPGNTLGICVNLTAGLMWFSKDGVTWYGGTEHPSYIGDPLTGANGFAYGLTGTLYPACSLFTVGDKITARFSSGFTFTAPGTTAAALSLSRAITLLGTFTDEYQESDFQFENIDNTGIALLGLIIRQDFDFRQVITSLGQLFGFDYYESGDKIKFKQRIVGADYEVNSSVGEDDLMPLGDDGTLEISRADPREAPQIVQVHYIDESRQYMQSMQQARTHSGLSPNSRDISTFCVMTATNALKCAARAVFRQAAERTRFRYRLTREWSAVEPTDIQTVSVDGLTYLTVVTKATVRSDLGVEVEAVALLKSETIDMEGYPGELPGFAVVPINVGSGSVVLTGGPSDVGVYEPLYDAGRGYLEIDAAGSGTAVEPGGPWTPLALTGLELWLDASDAGSMTIDGSNGVSQWNDKSGHARHATMRDAAKPIRGATALGGAYPGVTFDRSAADALHGAIDGITTKLTLYAVMEVDVIGDTNYRCISLSVGATNDFGSTSATAAILLSGSGLHTYYNGAGHIAVGLAANTPIIRGVIFDGTSLGQRNNGTAGTGATIVTPTFTTTDRYTLGIQPGSGIEGAGFVLSELIICHDETVADREKIEGYLAHRWGLAGSLPAGHPYKSAPP